MDLLKKVEVNEKLNLIGLDINKVSDLQVSFNISDEFKNKLETEVVEFSEAYYQGEMSKGEYVLSLISLGETEKERIYLAIKAVDMYLRMDQDIEEDENILNINISPN